MPIHAAAQVPEPEDRLIILRGKKIKRNLLLEIKNTITDETAHSRFGTDHYGTGLHNVQGIVDKYHGVMDISLEDSFFCVSILLPYVT